MTNQFIPNFIKKRASLTPNREAIEFKGKTYTFSKLYDKSYQIAGQLSALGLKKGQYVGVLLNNHADTALIYVAFQLIGLRAVILNNRLTSAELAWQLKDSKAQFVVTEEEFSAKWHSIQESLPNLKGIVKEELVGSAFIAPIVVDEVNLEDVCTVMYTSGTTGHPKGVLQTYGNHWWSAVGSALNLGLSEKDCWLCAVPMFHISGYSILMRSLIYGMKIVILDSFDEKNTIQRIHSEKVTIMSVVATMLQRIVSELKDERLPVDFRCMLLGGGPAPKTLLEQCLTKQIPVFQTYGMTETASQIVTLAPEDSLKKLGSAGKPLFPSALKIINVNGREAEANEAGEIFVKGPNVTSGYLNRKEETEKQFAGQWFSTGDIGYVDEEGFLYVLDRRSDLIISGGENIYPAEIEGVLVSHPAITDAGVIGMKDEQWGEVPVAFVVTKDNNIQEELIHYCQQHLAKYKVPKQISFLDVMPRNAAKKIMRKELRKLLD
ncbi:O-succinylbenzoic acid--CoA ligase [Cytobacillus eiseniae]|uniref:2-succinylbenzoate--CoA ligase n=1 Tax=Cytobacillus eiseniae TaxID=762947 RepID=A0ABS4RKY7_9BACI|nr:o-succinylbenzoate--CoA ligase [Cytobacillus eiseniae]MBP2243030.1 O-succinylbenzoic acid--CoA ligase [Cytobacillus eiseniae]